MRKRRACILRGSPDQVGGRALRMRKQERAAGTDFSVRHCPTRSGNPMGKDAWKISSRICVYRTSAWTTGSSLQPRRTRLPGGDEEGRSPLSPLGRGKERSAVARSRCDEAIQSTRAEIWIASLTLAMTRENPLPGAERPATAEKPAATVAPLQLPLSLVQGSSLLDIALRQCRLRCPNFDFVLWEFVSQRHCYS